MFDKFDKIKKNNPLNSTEIWRPNPINSTWVFPCIPECDHLEGYHLKEYSSMGFSITIMVYHYCSVNTHYGIELYLMTSFRIQFDVNVRLANGNCVIGYWCPVLGVLLDHVIRNLDVCSKSSQAILLNTILIVGIWYVTEHIIRFKFW